MRRCTHVRRSSGTPRSPSFGLHILHVICHVSTFRRHPDLPGNPFLHHHILFRQSRENSATCCADPPVIAAEFLQPATAPQAQPSRWPLRHSETAPASFAPAHLRRCGPSPCAPPTRLLLQCTATPDAVASPSSGICGERPNLLGIRPVDSKWILSHLVASLKIAVNVQILRRAGSSRRRPA